MERNGGANSNEPIYDVLETKVFISFYKIHLVS